MKSWYRMSADIDLNDGSKARVYKTVFETTDYDLSEESIEWCRSKMDKKPEQEFEDQTIYGFRVRDLVPLASVLRAKGVSPKEIEDWHKDLQGLLDFVAEQEMEAHQKAVADVLKGLEGPDKETGEWFAKAIGHKGEEE